MHKSNCKLPPFTAKKPQNNSIFTLSIKSKQKPFGFTQHKQGEQSQTQNQRQQILYFPTEQYKGFLKGQKIYLECYYKDKIFSSGYEPYIEAMGGEVMKRLSPGTTVIVTNQMTFEKYQKLKGRMAKICRPDTVIVSILWIQQIYRQKRKVQKQKYLFDQKTDIVDRCQQQDSEQDDLMSEQFERQVFKKDFINELQEYLKNPDEDIKFRISQNNNKKIKKQDFNNPHILWIMPHKFNVFENQEQEQKYKELAKTYKNPRFNNQKNDKKKQQKSAQQVNKRNTFCVGQKQKRRRTSTRRSQKMQIENKLQSKKQEINSKKQQQKKQSKQGQNQQKQEQQKQSDSEFLRRIRQKKQVVQQQSINTILDKYLNRADTKIEKKPKRLTDIQQVVSAENYSNELFVPQQMQIQKNPYKQSYENQFDKQNSQSGNQNKSQQNDIARLGSYTKSTKKSRPQKQRKSVVFTQQKIKQQRNSKTGPKTQFFSKTKSLGKSSNPKRQQRLSQLMNQFKVDIDEFLQKIGYIRDSEQPQRDKKNIKSLNRLEKIIYNVVVKQPYIISRVNDFNFAVKDKISVQKQVFFNLIDFQLWNKLLNKTPVLKFLINFRDLTENIMGKQERSKKIEIIKELFELEEVQEQTAISNYEVMCELVTSEDYCDLDFYFLCNKKNKEQVLMGYLSKIEKKKVLDYNVLKSIFELVSKKQSKSQQSSQDSRSFTISMISDTNSVKSKQGSLRQKIKQQIFNNHRIKARLTGEIILGKKITCIPIKILKNVEFIVKKLKAKFIPLQNYMSNKQNADIVINDKRSFSKVKNVWYPDYQTFVNSLIVIE